MIILSVKKKIIFSLTKKIFAIFINVIVYYIKIEVLYELNKTKLDKIGKLTYFIIKTAFI